MKWQKFVLGLVSSKLFLIPFPLEMLKMMRQNYDCFFSFFFFFFYDCKGGEGLFLEAGVSII